MAHGHDIVGGLYARGEAGGARHETAADAGWRWRRRRLGIPVLTPIDIKDAGSAGGVFVRSQCGCGRRRRLWHDPAAGDSRCARNSAVSICMARCCRAGAARRRSSARSCRAMPRVGVMVMKMDIGPRHRRCRHGRAAGDHRLHDGFGSARRAGAARRGSDGAGDGRAGTRQVAAHQTERALASPTQRRSTRPKRGSTGANLRA